MNILVLGGGRFVGRYIVQEAAERGHRVTVFNRGISESPNDSRIEAIRGDRDADLERLAGRSWDSVIDTCGYFPRQVAASAALAARAAKHYTYISTVSVYDTTNAHEFTESSPLNVLGDHASEDLNDAQNYGAWKALCEKTLLDALPDRVVVARLALVVGPRDYTDRFTYWTLRVAGESPLLAPVGPHCVLNSLIDVRDVAHWIVNGAESQVTGIYNLGRPPEQPITMGQLLESCAAVAGTRPEIRWASESFLIENEVQPWSEIPLWLPELFVFSTRKAQRIGLKISPLDETARATYEWARRARSLNSLKAGLKREREQVLLGMLSTAKDENF